jgi:hypothetical protein
MKTLLRADEGAIKKQSKIVSGTQIVSKIEFQNKRNGDKSIK